MRKAMVIASTTLLLVGCGGYSKPGFVADEWAKSMSEFAIYPVYPPREDIQVGDVYVAWRPKAAPGGGDGGNFRRPMIWMTSLLGKYGVTDFSAVSVFYKQRPNFPATPDRQAGQSAADTALPEAIVPNDGDIFAGGSSDRLRLVQFPAFNIAHLTQAQLGAVGPLGVVETLLGANYASDYSLSVSVPNGAAASYALPGIEVERLLRAYCKLTNQKAEEDGTSSPGTTATTDATFEEVVRRFGAMMHDTPRDEKDVAATAEGEAVMMVITEVFYSRALDYTLHSSSSFGAILQAKVARVDQLRQIISGLQTEKSKTDTTANDPNTSAGDKAKALTEGRSLDTQIQNNQRELAALQAELESTLVPGVKGKVVSASERGIKLEAEFSRPVAIGYRALTYRVPEGQAQATLPPGIAKCKLAGIGIGLDEQRRGNTVAAAPVTQPWALAQQRFSVSFAPNSTALDAEAMEVVWRVVKTFQGAPPEASIVVVGHADRTGGSDYNLILSNRRAEAVKMALISRGIAVSRITAYGVGEAEPAVSTPDGVAEHRNREATISIIGPTR